MEFTALSLPLTVNPAETGFVSVLAVRIYPRFGSEAGMLKWSLGGGWTSGVPVEERGPTDRER